MERCSDHVAVLVSLVVVRGCRWIPHRSQISDALSLVDLTEFHPVWPLGSMNFRSVEPQVLTATTRCLANRLQWAKSLLRVACWDDVSSLTVIARLVTLVFGCLHSFIVVIVCNTPRQSPTSGKRVNWVRWISRPVLAGSSGFLGRRVRNMFTVYGPGTHCMWEKYMINHQKTSKTLLATCYVQENVWYEGGVSWHLPSIVWSSLQHQRTRSAQKHWSWKHWCQGVSNFSLSNCFAKESLTYIDMHGCVCL